MLISNMNSKRGNPVANQYVISENNKVTFQSYASTIAIVDYEKKTITIGEDWDYSKTTHKYRNAFFDGLGFTVLNNTADMRKALNKGKYNDFTIIKAWEV